MKRRVTIPSERKDMLDREYAQHARSEAAAYGNAVAFWIRDNDPARAGRHARLAARWALKLLGRPA